MAKQKNKTAEEPNEVEIFYEAVAMHMLTGALMTAEERKRFAADYKREMNVITSVTMFAAAVLKHVAQAIAKHAAVENYNEAANLQWLSAHLEQLVHCSIADTKKQNLRIRQFYI